MRLRLNMVYLFKVTRDARLNLAELPWASHSLNRGGMASCGE